MVIKGLKTQAGLEKGSSMHYVITGATGGLGKELVARLCGRNEVTAIYNASSPNFDSSVRTLKCDLSEQTLLDFGYIKDPEIVLVHLGGICINGTFKGSDTSPATFEDYSRQFNVNVLGGLRVLHALWPKMKENKYGRIIFISSVVAHAPVFGTLGYAMSKGALEAATKELLSEGAKNNILPFCIASGYTEYGMIDAVPVEFQEKLKEKIPLRRFGTAEEFENTINFLVATPYMAGQTVHLNGGLYV